MGDIIKTDVLLDNGGKEYNLGRAYNKIAHLKVLTKEEAINAFNNGRRVYFIYQNDPIYRTHCRKVCKDLDYLKEHYECYKETCGTLVKAN